MWGNVVPHNPLPVSVGVQTAKFGEERIDDRDERRKWDLHRSHIRSGTEPETGCD